jgi:hypothetical protein
MRPRKLSVCAYSIACTHTQICIYAYEYGTFAKRA